MTGENTGDTGDTGDKGTGDTGDKGGEFKAPQSQEEFDRMVGQRLERERTKVTAQFADYDDLKQKAAEHDKAAEASKSEHQKAVDAARKEGETAATTAANTRIVAADARAAAATLKFRNPAAAVKLLDLSDVKVVDGEPDAEAIKAKLTKLAETDAYLVEADEKKPAPKKATALKSGASGGDENGTGKAGAAAAVRALRGAGT